MHLSLCSFQRLAERVGDVLHFYPVFGVMGDEPINNYRDLDSGPMWRSPNIYVGEDFNGRSQKRSVQRSLQ